MRLAYKYRLYPTANQARDLGIMLETHRRIYNDALAARKEAYETRGETLSEQELRLRFKAAKEAGNEFYARVTVDSVDATIRRLKRSYENFFRRVKRGEKPGFPRFKARGRFDSIEYPHYGNGIRLVGGRLRVLHVGSIKAKVHRPTEGEIKTARLKLEDDRWFVVLSCDLGEVAAPAALRPAVGIDVGIESFGFTSDGESIPNPRYLKKELPELRRRGRAVSRKRKGGKNRRKAVARLRRVHARVANLRREHWHQLSCKLVRRYGLIAVERLNVKGMIRNRRLARAISDAGWSAFQEAVRYKAERAGVAYVEIDPRNTSQVCSGCGALVPKPLTQRWHGCPHCGLSLHRDHNAARNILALALQARTGPAELNAKGSSAHVPRTRSSRMGRAAAAIGDVARNRRAPINKGLDFVEQPRRLQRDDS